MSGQQGGVMVQRAAFAESDGMTPEKGDYLCVTGYDCKKWCTVKIVFVARGSVGDHRFRVEFDVDGSFDELQRKAVRAWSARGAMGQKGSKDSAGLDVSEANNRGWWKHFARY